MSSLPQTIDTIPLTGDELFEMGDLGPCELIAGRIIPMTPAGGPHGFIELNVGYELKTFVKQNKLGWVQTGEVGIYTGRNPDTVRGADVIFISKKRLKKLPKTGFLEVAPELVVEIFSPSETWKEIEDKIDEYFAAGVKWIWVVNPKNRDLIIYQGDKEPKKLRENDTLIGEDILSGFELKISKLFEE